MFKKILNTKKEIKKIYKTIDTKNKEFEKKQKEFEEEFDKWGKTRKSKKNFL